MVRARNTRLLQSATGAWGCASEVIPTTPWRRPCAHVSSSARGTRRNDASSVTQRFRATNSCLCSLDITPWWPALSRSKRFTPST